MENLGLQIDYIFELCSNTVNIFRSCEGHLYQAHEIRDSYHFCRQHKIQ